MGSNNKEIVELKKRKAFITGLLIVISILILVTVSFYLVNQLTNTTLKINSTVVMIIFSALLTLTTSLAGALKQINKKLKSLTQ